MILITPSLSIDEKEIQLDFVRSSGPGGQNINKVATSVQLRFNVLSTQSLSPEVKQRLAKIAGHRMTGDGILLIEAKRFRTQELNRADAILRFIDLIQKSLQAPNRRKATQPTLASKIKRIQSKKRHGETKKLRYSIPDD